MFLEAGRVDGGQAKIKPILKSVVATKSGMNVWPVLPIGFCYVFFATGNKVGWNKERTSFPTGKRQHLSHEGQLVQPNSLDDQPSFPGGAVFAAVRLQSRWWVVLNGQHECCMVCSCGAFHHVLQVNVRSAAFLSWAFR